MASMGELVKTTPDQKDILMISEILGKYFVD